MEGALWRGKKLLFHCDNQSVVDIWAKGSSRNPLFMHLVQSIFLCAATHQFSILVTHICGMDNSISDALSHVQMFRFHQFAPQTDSELTAVPPKPRPSGWLPSLSSVSCHCTLHTSCLPSRNSQVYYLLLLQTMGSIPRIRGTATLLCLLALRSSKFPYH